MKWVETTVDPIVWQLCHCPTEWTNRAPSNRYSEL